VHHRFVGWHYGIPSHVSARETRAFIETDASGTVIAASKNFRWALGKPLSEVLNWTRATRLRHAQADTLEALKKKRGSMNY